jgi:uncharacterized protein (DUF433 family)
LIKEEVSGVTYEYYPVGDHIVVAPGVCGGRPVFKNTRISIRYVVDAFLNGKSMVEIADMFGERVSVEAVEEALRLAFSSRAKNIETRPALAD